MGTLTPMLGISQISPRAKRDEVAREFFPTLIREVTRQVADDGQTIKTLWELFDGSKIESVLMRYPNRTTLCISSQVGCGMGCPFCATGQLGLTRNMSPRDSRTGAHRRRNDGTGVKWPEVPAD